MTDRDNTSDDASKAVDDLAQVTGLGKTPTVDHIRNLVLAGLNLIPGVGGSLASLADSYIPSQKEARLIAFIEDLGARVQAVEGQIKADVVHTDGFAYVFEETLRGVMTNYQQDKIDCYRAIFINSLTGKGNATDEEQEIFLRLVNDLTVRHIRIMAILFLNNSGDILEVIQAQYPSYSQDDIYYIMDDLRYMGLVPAKGQIYDPQLSNNFNQLSTMGKKFVDFVTL